METSIDNFVKGCYSCNRSKHLRRKNKQPLSELTMGAPMEKVHIDILGPLPKSLKNNMYILVIVCQFSKWIELVPLPDQQAETVARAMVDNVFSRLGCPQIIFSDQGSNFNSGLFAELCDRLGITKLRTTAYRPSSNGQVERMNRTIAQAIRAVLLSNSEKQDSWDDRLQLIAGAMRSCVNRSTGFTPNFLMFGREVMQPLELMGGVQPEPLPVTDYVKDLEENLLEAHSAARNSLGTSQRRQKKYYDLYAYTKQFEVGDAVLIANSATKIGQSRKLQPLWLGPYLVVHVFSPALYRVASQKRNYVVHHDRMKICLDRALPFWLTRRRQNLQAPEEPNILDETLGGFIDEPLFCYCRKGYNGLDEMVACDGCGEWFHCRACLGLTTRQIAKLEDSPFFCRDCSQQATG